MEKFGKKKIQVIFSFVLLMPSTSSHYQNVSLHLHSASLTKAGDEVWCGGRLCGSSNEMECCSFDPFNCCNKNNQYCDQESCGMIQDGWYCGTCGSFDGNSCCNDGLTICQSQVCGHKEDYTCCDVNLRCCTIVPPEPPPTPLYALWWFWVGLIFCLVLLFFIGFVLWSDRHFIKYNIDKARGLNPQPPPGMPFHRRASTRIRSSFRESRQAVHRASMRLSQRRRRPRPGPATDTGTSADRPEVTHITGPPPFVNGPRSLRTCPPQPPFNPQSEAPPPYSAEPLGTKVSAEPSASGNRAGPSRDLAYENPTDERKAYPPISPSNDLTPRSEIKRYSPSGSSQQASRKEQIRNPAFNPDYDPSRPATFSQPQLQAANLNRHFLPLDSRGPTPQKLPHYGGRHPSQPLHHRGPLHQGYGYSRGPPPQSDERPPPQAPRGSPPQAPRGPPPQAPRGPPPQAPRGPPPQAPRRPPPLSQRGPVAHTLRGPQPLYLRGPTPNPNYPIRPPPQGPSYGDSPRTRVPSSRTWAPMPPGFGGNLHGNSRVYLNSNTNIDETII
ncbi:formin-like protein 20 [Penaeus chinensis]|uniref:formin-like protein 20 n=1 Tax=Penaeus chinensis TaxID=139456 RepID=UPI001FB81835|nr:formin-like protein 20 [Penaeus chinensis]